MRAAHRVQRATAVELLCDEQTLCSAPWPQVGVRNAAAIEDGCLRCILGSSLLPDIEVGLIYFLCIYGSARKKNRRIL